MRRRPIPKRLPRPSPPDAAEREYYRNVRRYAEAFIGKMRVDLKDLVPDLRDEIQEAQPVIARADSAQRMDAGGIEKSLRVLFDKITRDLKADFPDELLERWAWAMVDQVNKLGKKNIQKVAKRIEADVGPLLRDGQMTPFFRQVVGQNVGLIRSLSEDALPTLKNKLVAMIAADAKSDTIADAIQAYFGVTRTKAKGLARDQVSKLNGKVNEFRQKSLGGSRYTWRGSQDERERPDHRRLEGTVQLWSKPPIVDRASGRRGHPGEDFFCRCWAEMKVEDVLE